MKTKRTHKEVGNDDIVESEQFGLTKQIGGEKEDFYKVSVTVETESKKYTAEVMNLFVPLLRKIRREMKYDPNQVGLPLEEVDETTNEETGEITAVASTESNNELAQKVVDTFNEGQVNKPKPVKRASALNSARRASR